MAEENSRPAFDSIQSLVNAVGGVAMMLENTFFALTSSFRAILGKCCTFELYRLLSMVSGAKCTYQLLQFNTLCHI